MYRRIISIILMCMLLAVSFMPLASAGSTLYSSDGRTIIVPTEEVPLYKEVGWFDSPEEAKIITMYSMDGRTIDIVQAQRDAYKKVGWYDTKEEVMITMYSMDGRALPVYKAQGELYREVGWYYNLSDVTITMYDTNGEEHTVFKDNAEKEEKENNLYYNKKDVMQLMFADDGRTIYVPFNKVEDYLKVGWYRGGGKVDPSRPMVAITFDDGPGKYTDKILSCLEKYDARATFFVQGKNVAGYKAVLQRADALGCEIGNHTWNHVNLSSCGSSTIASQISNTNNAVFNAIGKYPALCRPPYGAYNSTVKNSVSMPIIMWSVDTLDWKTRNAQKTLASVKKSTTDGAIILMHDIHSPTADAAEMVIPYLLKQGYQLVTVSELINARHGYAVNGKVYNKVN
ncbi:MAG: polysaccharide deacetylase family protein [Clostridia bacterium]|nr:polysaccharide deacetylase family protein [Clostridia bacterium]